VLLPHRGSLRGGRVRRVPTGGRSVRTDLSRDLCPERRGEFMKRARITYLIALPAAALVLAGAAYATATANAGTGTGTGGSAADQVRTAERTLLRAMVNGNTHTAGALLAPDLQLIDPTGTAETRADNLADIGGGIDFVTIQPIEPISVRVHGDS